MCGRKAIFLNFITWTNALTSPNTFLCIINAIRARRLMPMMQAEKFERPTKDCPGTSAFFFTSGHCGLHVIVRIIDKISILLENTMMLCMFCRMYRSSPTFIDGKTCRRPDLTASTSFLLFPNWQAVHVMNCSRLHTELFNLGNDNAGAQTQLCSTIYDVLQKKKTPSEYTGELDIALKQTVCEEH